MQGKYPDGQSLLPASPLGGTHPGQLWLLVHTQKRLVPGPAAWQLVNGRVFGPPQTH